MNSYENAKKKLLCDCEVEREEIEMGLERLKEFAKPYVELLPRVEMKRHVEVVMRGLLTDLERKSVEPIAEQAGEPRRTLQYFMGESPWDHEPLIGKLCEKMVEDLGEANGVLVIDPSGFPKKGRKSVGVQRQWCGRLGKTDNCQIGVFMGYVSNKGHALADERLYLPREWARDRKRKEECHVPKSVKFKTAQGLALDMLKARGQDFPHSWVVADAEFGRGHGFRKELEKMKERYLLEIPYNRLIRVIGEEEKQKRGRGWPRKSDFIRASAWKDKLTRADWEEVHVRDGTKGPLVVNAARVRVQTKDGKKRSKQVRWLMVIKTREKNPEYRYYLSNAEETVSLKEMVHAASARYWVEDCFERAKGKVGLDQYELRTWRGWHHHITLCLLALYFLVLEQRQLNKKTPAMTLQQSAEALGEILRNPNVDTHALAIKITRRLRRSEQTRISHWKKFNRLPPVWSFVRDNVVPNIAL
jgi:SRSO17 transposase